MPHHLKKKATRTLVEPFGSQIWFNFFNGRCRSPAALPIRAPFFFETETAGLMCARHSWPQSVRWCVPRLKQLWQLGDIHCDAQCLIACELSYQRLPIRLILKMDVREWLACFVMHNKTA